MFRTMTHFAVAVLFVFVAAGCQSTTGETAGEQLSDAGITSAVKTKLTAERAGNLTQVGVETVRKTVYLTGVVPSAEDKRRAGEVARSADGVKEVVNNLQVRAQ
jgi:hyperosmotically inducible periplasmic protein